VKRFSTIALFCALFAVAWISGTPAAVADGTLVDDVVRMLGAEIEPSLIASWLDLQEPRAEPLTPDDMIRLSEAGAPEDLVRRLMAKTTPESVVTAPPPATPRPAPATTPAPVVVSTDTPASTGDLLPVAFVIRYTPFTDFEAQDRDDLELHLYMDGRPLASTPNQANFFRSRRLRITRDIAPGRHEIRLLRERHKRAKRRGPDEWRHESTVCPDTIEFEVTRDHEWTFELSWSEPRHSATRAPLSWRLLRDGAMQDGVEKTGTPKDEWPPLCEDIEAGIDPDRKIPKSTQRALDRCVRWAELWTDKVVDPPSRAEVLAELEARKTR
jgi:hypothetical protein